MEFYDTFWFTWVIIPFLIFIARVSDVTIGTLRIVFISKGYKILAPILGFFEVFIWLLAMGKIFQNLDNWMYYVAYSAGFAVGNYIGLIIEEKLALGFMNLRIITHEQGDALIKRLANEGFGITSSEAQGTRSRVNIIYCVIKRSDYKLVADIIQEYNPNAFYTLEDIRFANMGVFPVRSMMRGNGNFPWRKGK
ncbi:DUF2179 domain-containing protein [Alkalitalea saponilacus]|uniref:UPF0316 protein SAMN03080601_00947 n=1 Tax=Alkalitalea saponilacus TaxID=889453 RepID=A0A1T5D2F5_9BACT|nr:DUF2179 domain-containing protein [Alkalitalea saponilacus]ASB50552.1 hypothetical protein CDL62_16075 [Alkalitalea saponilacus]SKB65786.1 Uncharacterized protein YebE, UPF0316 family [Alkalitalea saponilacus]